MGLQKLLTPELIALGVGVATFAALNTRTATRRFWRAYHDLANRFFISAPKAIMRAYALDGDTIDAYENGRIVRFRLANIDAPETGDNARCAHERLAGELATAEARDMILRSKNVAVRRTWRHDIYGRRIAFVLIDGIDLGQTLIANGLAQPWRGRREKWCGAKGGLAAMAARRGQSHNCALCQQRR